MKLNLRNEVPLLFIAILWTALPLIAVLEAWLWDNSNSFRMVASPDIPQSSKPLGMFWQFMFKSGWELMLYSAGIVWARKYYLEKRKTIRHRK